MIPRKESKSRKCRQLAMSLSENKDTREETDSVLDLSIRLFEANTGDIETCSI